MSALARPVTKDEVAAYNINGVVLLRGILDLATVNSLRRNIDEAVRTMADSPAGYNLSQLTSAIEAYDQSTLKQKSDGQYDVSAIADHILSTGKPFLKDEKAGGKGSFLLDTGIAERVRDFKRFTLRGPGRRFPPLCSAARRSTSSATRFSSRSPAPASAPRSTRTPPISKSKATSAACCGSRSIRSRSRTAR